MALAATPAFAICSGCTGGAFVTMGVADAATVATGTHRDHVLNATCSYATPPVYLPNPQNWNGVLTLSATGSTPPTSTDPRVEAVCRVKLKDGQSFSVSGSGVTQVREAIAIPGHAEIEAICLTATAEWYRVPAWDHAVIDWCVGPGASFGVNPSGA
jgi:hypothetical protein